MTLPMRKLNLILALCAFSPLCWQPLCGQTVSGGVHADKKNPDDSTRSGKATDTRGAKENPLVVDTLGHQQTAEELKEAEKQATNAEAEERYHHGVDRWTFIWSGIAAVATGALAVVGISGTIVAIKNIDALSHQINQMKTATWQASQHLSLTERPWLSLTTES